MSPEPTGLRVVVLPGDGIGPEVTEQAVGVLRAATEIAGIALTLEERRMGGAAIDAEGTPLSEETLDACVTSDAVLLGAVGGPKWDQLSGDMRCESGLLRLRKGMGVFANVRPVWVPEALADRSTLKREVVQGVDLVVVRELTGGVYFGQPKERRGEGADESAVDTMIYTRREIERVARFAFEKAQQRDSGKPLVSVDKANVLVTSQLWREVVGEVAVDFPQVRLENQLVDAAAMRLIRAPRDFDVIVTENLFGDILTDEAAMLSGSLGMLPSASLSGVGPGLFEPIHGSAPDIAGKGLANPLGAILSVAMLLDSVGLAAAADGVRGAVEKTIEAGHLTSDLGGSESTGQVGSAVLAALPRMVPDTVPG
ncbi:MAG: 3-isopropylmalate dehydrogenase [Candidatus Dormiibacterota bacterium]